MSPYFARRVGRYREVWMKLDVNENYRLSSSIFLSPRKKERKGCCYDTKLSIQKPNLKITVTIK